MMQLTMFNSKRKGASVMKELCRNDRKILDYMYQHKDEQFTPDDISQLGFDKASLRLDRLRGRGLLKINGLRYQYRDFT